MEAERVSWAQKWEVERNIEGRRGRRRGGKELLNSLVELMIR